MIKKLLWPKAQISIEPDEAADPRFVCEHCGKKHPQVTRICSRCDRTMSDPPEFSQYMRREQAKLPKFIRGAVFTEEVFDAQDVYESWEDEARRNFLHTRLGLRKDAPRYKEPKPKPKRKRKKYKPVMFKPLPPAVPVQTSLPLSDSYAEWLNLKPAPVSEELRYERKWRGWRPAQEWLCARTALLKRAELPWIDTWIKAVQEAPCVDTVAFISHVALQLGPAPADRARVLEAAEERRRLLAAPAANWEI